MGTLYMVVKLSAIANIWVSNRKLCRFYNLLIFFFNSTVKKKSDRILPRCLRKFYMVIRNYIYIV